jgi:hypothetical protein
MTVKVWLFIKKTSGEPVTLRYQLAPLLPKEENNIFSLLKKHNRNYSNVHRTIGFF